ncbi:hypothetical protein [Mucilaginibacter sp.]|uniref:hypothetical protein n=1 Tax=Mucilaginibacter sp. TaxID=1882438 RepID=UPI002622AB04|nr:hypothetical protein [Mucilaginibacter sp.]MDB5032021.1 hypothetical protein [Mucilaginibacter sp.]
MKSIFINRIKYSLSLCLFMNVITAFGQKPPNVQTTSMQAPKRINIDGRSAEWGNKFEAYNNSTDVFYSISNDDKYLYVILQATNIDIINKIIKGGITVSVNPKEKEFLAGCKSITFPVIKLGNASTLIKLLDDKHDIKNNTLNYSSRVDSLTKLYNSQLEISSSEIKIANNDMAPDSLISVYNDKHLLVAGALDNKEALTYEFKIPLRFLGMSYVKSAKVYYNIKLSGRPNLPPRPANDRVASAKTVGITNYSAINLQVPTNFWGEYVLF